MLHYPQEYPGDAARLIVANWRSGKIASERAATAEAAWNLVGYGLKASIGEGTFDADAAVATATAASGGTLSMQSNPAQFLTGDLPDDEEMIAKLEAHDTLSADKKLMAGLPLPPKMLITWAMNFAVKILLGMVG